MNQQFLPPNTLRVLRHDVTNVLLDKMQCLRNVFMLLSLCFAMFGSSTVGAQEDIESRIADLIRATENARSQINKQLTPGGTQEPTDMSGLSDSLLSSDNAYPLNDISDIRKRLQLLRRLRLNPRPSSNPSFPRGNDPGAVAPNTLYQPAATAPLENLNATIGTPTLSQPVQQPTLTEIEANVAPPTPEQAPEAPVPTSMEAQKVLPSAVDHLQLGQSLYQTKNYSAALKALKVIDPDSLSIADQNWLELLTALCQRRIGERDAAQAAFRVLANTDGNDFTGPVASWWLSQSELVDNARMKLQDINDQLGPLQERIESHVKR